MLPKLSRAWPQEEDETHNDPVENIERHSTLVTHINYSQEVLYECQRSEVT